MFYTVKQALVQYLELFWQCSILAKNHYHPFNYSMVAYVYTARVSNVRALKCMMKIGKMVINLAYYIALLESIMCESDNMVFVT